MNTKDVHTLMKVLSLFDGIAVARQALEDARIPVAKYYSSEIDIDAIKIAQYNWFSRRFISLGDITRIDSSVYKDIGKIDLLIGGSPCQDLSKVGKQAGLGPGTRSSLVHEYARILNELKPTWFILENVEGMKQDWKDIISGLVGVQPIRINSCFFTPQLRKRLYWTNIPNVKDLILPSGNTPPLPNRSIRYILQSAATIDNKYYPDPNKKWFPIDSQMKWSREGTRQMNPSKESGGRQPFYFNRVYDVDGRCIALTQWSNRLWIWDSQLTANEIRRLTPVECERLQGLPDNYTQARGGRYARKYGSSTIKWKNAPDTLRYKVLGNSFTAPVIQHLLEHIP